MHRKNLSAEVFTQSLTRAGRQADKKAFRKTDDRDESPFHRPVQMPKPLRGPGSRQGITAETPALAGAEAGGDS